VIPSPGSYVIRYYPIGSDETQLSDWSTWDGILQNSFSTNEIIDGTYIVG
jgi:hypothetical protein